MISPPQRPRFFYGYIVIGAAFIIQIITWGIYNSFGVFFNALLDEFGWSYALISGAASVSQFLVGVGAVFMGRLNDRFGPRRIMLFAAVVVGLGFFLMRYTENPWQLYLFTGVIVGIGISGTDVVLLSTAARWFKRRRGVMSGMVKLGTGVGTMLMPLALTALISAFGWRDTYAMAGGALFLVVLIASRFLYRDPSLKGLLPDGEPVTKTTDINFAESGFALHEAVRSRAFWMLCLVFFASFFCTFSTIVHIAPASVDMGMTEGFASGMVSVIGGASIVGRLFMGFSNDRIGSRRALIYMLVLLVGGFVWLQFVSGSSMLVLFGIVYGLCHGGFYTLISPVVAEFFGMRSHGFILGFVVFAGGIGGAIGPFIIGRMYDATGSYAGPFLLMLCVAVIGAAAMLSTGKPRPEPAPPGPQAFTGTN